MVDAVLFATCVFSAGVAGLRALGLAKGILAVGLAPGVGFALLAVVSTWIALLGVSSPVAGVAMAVIGASGVVVMLRERTGIVEAARGLWRERPLAVATLMIALAVPIAVMSVAFAGVEVPLSPHDGAAHTEAIQAYRLGSALVDWYPPGLTALFAAWLQLAPWLDSAKGAFELGLSLPLLGAVAVFGLSVAVWGDLTIAAAGALLLGLTYVYPYFPELWSGWPLAASLVLVVSTWAAAYAYLERPWWRLAVLAGLMLGAVIVTHGTEVYTLAIILTVALAANWRRIRWPGLGRDVAIALGVGLVAAAIYLPTLLHWQGASGAYAVGLEDAQVPSTATAAASISAPVGPDPFVVFALGALGVDLPLRVGLLCIGVGWVFFRSRGRGVVVVAVLFTLVTSAFTLLSGRIDLVRQVYAFTFPWGMHYRIFMMVALCQVLLAGAGAVVLVRWFDARFSKVRIARRLPRVLVPAWLALAGIGMAGFLAYPTGLVLGYGPDDALAMAWLRAHAAPGEVLVNDGYSDAGIWAPYKAGVPVLLPRWGPDASDPARLLVWRNVLTLDRSTEAMAAACALNARYVYRGANASEWDARSFPSLGEMEAAPGLRRVFRSGEAGVFQILSVCPATVALR